MNKTITTHIFFSLATILCYSQISFAFENKETDIVKRLQDKGFSLQRSIYNGGALDTDVSDESALFTYSRNYLTKKSVSTSDFAILKNNKNKSEAFVIEGHLASNDTDTENAIQIGYLKENYVASSPTKGFYKHYGIKMEGNRDLNTQKIIGEFLFTPTNLAIRIGTTQNDIYWRPYISIQAGKTIKQGNSEEKEKTILRIPLRVRSQFYARGLAHFLGTKREKTFFYIDNTLFALPLESKSLMNMFKAGFEIPLNDNANISISYRHGQTAPDFKNISSSLVGIGFKF